jgi:hypothetical protein
VSGEVLFSAVSAFAAILAVVVAWLAHHANSAVQSKSERVGQIETTISVALKPVTEKLTEFGVTMAGLATSLTHVDGEMEKSGIRIGSLMDRTSVLETKVELWWKQVALQAAQILHQPDPRRAAVDKLLEAFMSGHLTRAQESELRRYLTIIRDYEPGQETPFPVQQGEQMSAAILLSTMQHVL